MLFYIADVELCNTADKYDTFISTIQESVGKTSGQKVFPCYFN